MFLYTSLRLFLASVFFGRGLFGGLFYLPRLGRGVRGRVGRITVP